MEKEKTKRILTTFVILYWLLVVLIYLIAHPQFRYQAIVSDALSPGLIVGEVVDGVEIVQRVKIPAEEMTDVSLMTDTYGRKNSGTLHIEFTDEDGNQFAQAQADVSLFESYKYVTIPLTESLRGYKDDVLLMTITTKGCSTGNALTIYAGNMMKTGRFDIAKEIAEEELYTINGQPGMGSLCVKLHGMDELSFYKVYWLLTGGMFAFAALLCTYWWRQMEKGKNNTLVALCTVLTRYDFLIRQLVGRDFKVKYKRSMIGVAWSFLNPFLTMLVQYVVFSTLFKSDIPYFSVYLFSGVVFFNFFSEAVGSGMTAITGNASLIKKVYMPKYVFPISKILSALINFGLSLLPMFLVMLVSGVKFTPALFLLVFDVLCMLGFITGMVLMLTTAMTFFQDTQFLWGVVNMMWMYLTPLFYPENIIPVDLLPVYRMNPMYQYVTFARVCILDGVSPAPMAYIWCLATSLIVMVLGITVFKRNQDKFIMYL